MDSLDKNEANIMIQMNKKEDKYEVGNIRRDDKFGNLDLVTSTENQLTADNTAAHATEENVMGHIISREFALNPNQIPTLSLT